MQIIDRSIHSSPYFFFDRCKQVFQKATLKVADFVKEHGIFLAMGALLGGCDGVKKALIRGAPIIPFAFIGAATGAIGSAVIYIFLKVIFKSSTPEFIPNLSYRIGKVWTVDQITGGTDGRIAVEQALKRVVEELKKMEVKTPGYPTRTAYEIVDELLKDKHSKGSMLEGGKFDDVQGFLRILKQGLCFGQARAQMQCLHKSYSWDSEKLHRIPVDHPEAVIYYQIMQHIEASLMIGGKRATLALSWSFLKDFEHYPRLFAQAKQCAFEIIRHLRVPSHAQQIALSSALSCQEPAVEYQKAFDQAIAAFPSHLAIAGWIEVKSNNDQTPGHAIWFQCSDQKFRFQDTINDEQGFFEFPNKKQFFEGLRKQINFYPTFKMGQIQFQIYGIQKQ